MAAPFVTFIDHTVRSWLPPGDSQTERLIEALTENNSLLREKLSESKDPGGEIVEEHLDKNNDKIQVMRSITSQSFRNIFRPIGRSADSVSILSGRQEKPTAVVTPNILARLEADKVDADEVGIVGTVNSFSRSSKTGIMFSPELGRGFRFEVKQKDPLPRRDAFSYSQYYGRPIRIVGRFVRFFDGNIKKFIVSFAEPLDDEYMQDQLR